MVITIAMAAALMSLSTSAIAARQNLGWSEPVKVSTPIQNQVDWWPAVAADDQGDVHIVWNTTQFADDIGKKDPDAAGQLAYVRWDGSSWTQQVDLGLIWYGYALRNSIAADTRGRVHLIFKGWGDLGDTPGRGGQELFYMSAEGNQANAYAAWSRPVKLQSTLAYYPVIQIDSKGVLHALWSEVDNAGKFGLYHSRSADGGATWSPRTVLESTDPVWWYRAQMKIDQHDRIHVVYEIGGEDNNTSGLSFGTTRAAVYMQSIDQGRTWSRHVFSGVGPRGDGDVATMAPGPQQPTIGVDGAGNILLVYREAGNNRIVYRASTDGSQWSPAVALPGITSGVTRPYDIYDTCTDSAGHVHLVAVGYPTGSTNMSVLHSGFDGLTWSAPDVLMSGPQYPEYPRLAIGQGNRLHVVWFTGDKPTTNRTPTGIWYSTASADAPHRSSRGRTAPPIPAPVTVNTPTSVPTPNVVPTSQVLPDSSRATYDPGRSSDGRVDATFRDMPAFPILAALVPVLLAVALLLVTQLGGPVHDRLRRR